ncbi:tyrosine-type recombinase/integrase [bacterium]|nr:tyrosine-type recombinase/integrase [bacterium]
MTSRTAIRRFVTQLEADGKSPLTTTVYRSELDRFARWLGSRPIDRIRPDTLARYLTSPAALQSPAGYPRSARTVNRTRTVLRLFFAYLTEVGTVRRDPARLLKLARTDRGTPTSLTDDEVRRFRHALDVEAKATSIGQRDRALFTLLLDSGMRLSAALGLQVRDLDLETGTASTTGKHGRVQDVVLPNRVVRVLRQHLKRERITSGPVFRGRTDRLSPRSAQYRFHRIVELAGIDRPVTVHSLRHTFATRLRRKTGDLRIVQVALGHRQLGTTEVYAHVGVDEVRRAVS